MYIMEVQCKVTLKNVCYIVKSTAILKIKELFE